MDIYKEVTAYRDMTMPEFIDTMDPFGPSPGLKLAIELGATVPDVLDTNLEAVCQTLIIARAAYRAIRNIDKQSKVFWAEKTHGKRLKSCVRSIERILGIRIELDLGGVMEDYVVRLKPVEV